MSVAAVGVQEVPSTRRERLRRATVDEIKRLAWAQVAEGGARGVSLRAVAREMGMTSSALYRYFASHEQLVAALIVDGLASLADELEEAEAGLTPGTPADQQFLHVARRYRSWAIGHPTEYALVFGTPMCDPRTVPDPRVLEEHGRGVAVLFRVMITGLATGQIGPGAAPAPSPALVRQLGDWQVQTGLPLDAGALANCLFLWTQLHGAISVEVFGQLPLELTPGGELFDQHMRVGLIAIGCRTATADGPGPG